MCMAVVRSVGGRCDGVGVLLEDVVVVRQY